MRRAKKIYTEGCLKGFHQWIEGHILAIGYMFSAIVIPEVRNLLMTDQLRYCLAINAIFLMYRFDQSSI